MWKIKKKPKAEKIAKKGTKKIKRNISTRTVVLIAIVVVYMVVSYYNLKSKEKVLTNQIDDVNKQIAEQNIVSEELNNEKVLINSDEYIEDKARKLGMVKPEERVYIDITK